MSKHIQECDRAANQGNGSKAHRSMPDEVVIDISHDREAVAGARHFNKNFG